MHTRAAIVKHIEMTIPKSSPHHITARHNLGECRELLAGEDSVRFTHIVLDLADAPQIVLLLDQVLASESFRGTTIVIITDVAFRRELAQYAPKYNHERLETERRVRFVFKPLKPSKLAVVFDPRKEGELSNDRNQDSAQAMAVTQKQIFDDLKKKLGNRGFRVLLVEDNKTNQMVLVKFLNKVSITVECVLDGVQCTEKVFSQPHGYYSIILVRTKPMPCPHLCLD
jgi:CheY-like chemotaxis protein